jgi:hypothetical protein
MVILFGEDQTKLDKSTDLHTNIIKFNFGFNDKDRLGDIRNTLFEQKVLSELSQLLENDINPEHKIEAGKLELVKLIHRNLTQLCWICFMHQLYLDMLYASTVHLINLIAKDHTDLMQFLRNCNIQDKIILASRILIGYIRS